MHGWGGTEKGICACVLQVSERQSGLLGGGESQKERGGAGIGKGKRCNRTGRRIVMLLSRDWGR